MFGTRPFFIISLTPSFSCFSPFSAQLTAAPAGYSVLAFSFLAEVCTSWHYRTSVGSERSHRWADFASSPVGPGYFSHHGLADDGQLLRPERRIEPRGLPASARPSYKLPGSAKMGQVLPSRLFRCLFIGKIGCR